MKLGAFVRISAPEEARAKFRALREAGFAACHLVYKPETYCMKDAPLIRQAADEEGIEIAAQFCGYYDNDTVWDNHYGFLTAGLNVEAYRASRLAYVRKAAEFAHEMGVSDIVIHAGYIPNNPFDPAYAMLKTAVELLSAHCEKLGMNLLLETGGESPVTLLRLFCDIGRDNLFINLDPANMLMYGYANPVDALYTVGKYVRGIHGKDGVPPTDPVKLGSEMPVGEGMVDFYAMFRKLKELGYDRYIIIEREIEGEQQTKDILKAKAYFETMLQEIYS